MIKTSSIILCGLDGSGKTTQSKKLMEYFRNHKIDCEYIWLRYPNLLSLPFAGLLRLFNVSAFPLTQVRKNAGINNLKNHLILKKIWRRILLLDFKFVTFFKIIIPIEKGKILILDRFVIDALVDLAIITGKDEFQKTSENFLKLIPANSKIFLLDLNPTISFERNKEEELETLITKRKLYIEIAKSNNFNIINAEQSIDTIHQEIINDLKLKENNI